MSPAEAVAWLRLDTERRFGGRGFYLHPNPRCAAGIRRGKALVPPDRAGQIYDVVQAEIGKKLSQISISSTAESKNVVDHRSEDASV
jgi:hypothetical protein